MRPLKIMFLLWGTFFLPAHFFAQFGLENDVPLQADYFFEKATRHHDASEFTQAACAYRKALSHRPAMTDAWYNLALVQAHIGEYREAERSLDTLFFHQPTDAHAYALHGLVLYRQGEYRRAVAAYNFALTAQPSAQLFLARGLAYFGVGDLYRASLDFDEVLANDPGNLRACQAKATILLEKGNHHLSIRFCNRILDQVPGDAAALTTRAVCRYRQGAKFRAMSDFELALANGPVAEVYRARATCRLEEGNLTGAMNDARHALRTEPLSAETYSLLATIEMAGGKYGEATESLKIALELAPENARFHFEMAHAALANADFKLAADEAYTSLGLGLEEEKGKAFLRLVYAQMDAERKNGPAD